METIFALATATGRAGVAVVRVSGTGVENACAAFGIDVPVSRRVALRDLSTASGFLDRALVVSFEEGRSFTGEAVVEFHLHGSPAVVRAVLAHLSSLTGFRVAGPGEFTRRALENGRLSLTEVEGLSDLLLAETEVQRIQATRLFRGELARVGERWRSQLLFCVAQVEALIDFSDEDLGELLDPRVQLELDLLRTEIAAELQGSRGAERVSDGFEVAIVGEPNCGKSTLLNRIARREAALTSEIAGTTRDVIELRYDLRGLAVTFLDTAGVRDSSDLVEAMGIQRTRQRAEGADLRIFLGPVPSDFHVGSDDLVVGAKADLGGDDCWLAVSGLTGEGVDRLLETVHDKLALRVPGAALVVRERQRASLEAALCFLGEAGQSLSEERGLEFAAESLRAGLRSLEMMLGRVGVEDVLGEIFSTFCIGK